ncbi:MAG: CotH kinase family protein [Chitinophagales bacterium]
MKSFIQLSKSILLICLSILLWTACEKSTDSPSPPPTPDFTVPTITPSGNEQYLNLKSDYIFDQEKLHTFELKIPDASLSKLDADPTAEEYVEGMLIFEGDTISPVGVRYKGSIGAFSGCVSNFQLGNPSGYKTCTKLSMKVKINWEGREEKFYKLKKLQFHSQNNDDSQMHDRLGYWLFRSMGVSAPRSVHARLVINGKYSGLYALTEQIDGRFTRYNFDDGEGNLYKEIWPLSMNGFPYSEGDYLNALETNEDENPSIDIIRRFGQRIADASPSDIQQVIAESMNINEIMSYAVVDRMIRHDDGPFHWYCGGGECTNHNYFWYEEPTNKQLHLIPWDMDNAFQNIISPANPVTPIADKWGETRNNCQPFAYGFLGIEQWSASCDKLTAAWVSFEEEYETLKTEFKNGPFAEEEVNTLIDTWTAQIREATIEARETYYGDAISVQEWEAAIAQLKNRLAFARLID